MIFPSRSRRRWAFCLLGLAACGGSADEEHLPSPIPSLTEDTANDQPEMIQQGIALTYIETAGNANMDMDLDMMDARLALRRRLGLVAATSISPLALVRPNNYLIGIDDVMFIAQKVNGVRSGLQLPNPLGDSVCWNAPVHTSCGGQAFIDYSIYLYTTDAYRMQSWPAYDGSCSTAYGFYSLIESVESAGAAINQSSIFQDICSAFPTSYPVCIWIPIRDSEGNLTQTLWLETNIQVP